jgi:hypothetical protein
VRVAKQVNLEAWDECDDLVSDNETAKSTQDCACRAGMVPTSYVSARSLPVVPGARQVWKTMVLFVDLGDEVWFVHCELTFSYCLNNFSRSPPCSAPERSLGGIFLPLPLDGESPPRSG